MRALTVILWLLAPGLVALVLQLDSPYLLDLRGLFYLALPVLLLGLYFWFTRTGPSARALPALVMLGAIFAGIIIEDNRGVQKARVLAADPALLRTLGRHIVLGYRQTDVLEDHLRRQGIGGIFLNAGNVRGRASAAIAGEIAHFQALGAAQGRPLFVTADQEGGPVSRLSPPLEELPPLQNAVDAADEAGTKQRVRAYASRQAAGLRGLGVNVNFAPVVDLKKRYDNPLDFHTRIADRALHEQPRIVTLAAREYARELRAGGVLPTLKHFPGLGQVPEDTHHFSAAIHAAPAALETGDWVPFREVSGDTGAMIMLGHVRVAELDPQFAASQSAPVVRLLREDWGHRGLLITDDMCMNPVVQSPGGMGAASVRALNAGVDLILITYHPERYFETMDALIQAWAEGRLNRVRLRESAGRIEAARAWLGAAALEGGPRP